MNIIKIKALKTEAYITVSLHTERMHVCESVSEGLSEPVGVPQAKKKKKPPKTTGVTSYSKQP